MKLLVLGDFHGTFPSKINKIIQKEKIDLVVSNGDYFPFLMRKLFFKHIYKEKVNKGLWSVIGKKRYKEIMLKELKMGEDSIKKLNAIPKPVLTVVGNLDYSHDAYDVFDINSKDYKVEDSWAWAEKDFFAPIIKKYNNIHKIDYSYFLLGNLVFIGMNGHSFPGRVKSKAFRKSKKKLDGLFGKFKGKQIIFVSHNIAYNTKLDLITAKDAHKIAKNKHAGSKLARRIVDQYQPFMHIGGHIHEGRGIQKVGKTLCLNPGSVHEGEMSIVDIQGKQIKIKLIK